uniref:Titin n=1 Tax=Hucho hucho TaxID=62062 RepID=A0A4W5NMF1_9TELE
MKATTCKVTSLRKGNEYIFRVKAVNEYGEGEALESEPTKATDPFTVPAAPTDVEITSITSETMTICWKRPDPPSIPCKLTKAEDPQFLPSPPAKPKVLDSTKTSVTLSWNKPLFDGGAAVTGYSVEYKRTDEEDWCVSVSNTENTEFTVVGLTSGAEYVFVVKSINKIGVSEPSPPTDPQAAEDREEEPQFNISNEMRKTLLVKDGSSFTLTVPFRGKPVPNVMWDKADVDLRASNLCEGCEYEYRVYAENVAGLSPPSIPCKLTKAEDPQFLPSPPAKPKVLDSTKTSVTLSWNKPLFDGGAAVTGYSVEYKRTDEEDWCVSVSNTENTEFTVVGLTSGAEYVFVVKSINKIGVSEPSPPTDPQAAEDREEEPQFNISNEMRKTLLVKDGSSFTLTVPFRGKPVPNVMWDKADVDLRVRASIHTTDTVTSITVEQATRDDSGKYTVTLQNVAGKVTCTLNVRDVTKSSATV